MLNAYRSCTLCPRNCEADRFSGKTGHCGQTASLQISSIGPHFGEEPPISGRNGSGTIFFTGCSMGCFFCQNYQISRENMGREYSMDEFIDQTKSLIGLKVHNLNFVTPDHFWPHIKALAEALKTGNIRIPLLINSSGYQKPETVLEMAEVCDIFMPDFKFSDPDLAEFCMGRKDYPEVAAKAIGIMAEKKGFLDASPATRGVLVRHLILPGEVKNSIGVLKMLKECAGRYVHLSLMSQYHPTPYCKGRREFGRGIAKDEFQSVLDAALDLGFENIFYQIPGGGTDFFPDFSKKEPFRGNRRDK